MAQTVWYPRDVFTFDKGHGVVLRDNVAVLVTGNPRTRYVIEQGPIPEDAQPTRIEASNSEVRLALRGAIAAISL